MNSKENFKAKSTNSKVYGLTILAILKNQKSKIPKPKQNRNTNMATASI